MSVTIYHNPRCSKSRATLALLDEHNAGATVVKYLTTPPSVYELEKILVLLGMTPRELSDHKTQRKPGLTTSTWLTTTLSLSWSPTRSSLNYQM
jgi:arsenate reductase (glutaredoxin)